MPTAPAMPPTKHARPESQVRTWMPASFGVRQHGCPEPPHVWHERTPIIKLPHTVPEAVHVLPGVQQGSPTLPHAAQVRAVPTAPAQIAPLELHVALLQQGSPTPPQISQLVPPSTTTQPLPAAVHSPLTTLTFPRPQHACPMPPHAVHVAPPASATLTPMHVLLVQFLPGQQASPAAPQATHCVVG
jgi:hypothetical protein